jgi:hypothetical protein
MLSRLIKILFGLTAIAPILVSVSYVQATKHNAYQISIIAACLCLLMCGIAVKIIERAGKALERIPVKVKKAKSAEKEVVGFFVAYVLPLLFKDVAISEPGVLVVAGVMLVFVLWTTRTFQVNPVLAMFGYRFYDAEMEDGMTYLLITKRNINDLRSVTTVAQLSEHGLLDTTNNRKINGQQS